MKVGDWFMGCPECWTQYPVRAAGPTRCRCGGRVLIYDLKEKDRAEIKHHNEIAARLAKNRSEYS